MPDSKTGAKVVPLGAPALQQIARIEESPFVFPSSRGKGPIVGLQKIWNSIRQKAGLDDVRRMTCVTASRPWRSAGGDTLYLVGKVLGHSQAATTQRYADVEGDPVRAVTTRAAGKIVAALKGHEKPRASFSI